MEEFSYFDFKNMPYDQLRSARTERISKYLKHIKYLLYTYNYTPSICDMFRKLLRNIFACFSMSSTKLFTQHVKTSTTICVVSCIFLILYAMLSTYIIYKFQYYNRIYKNPVFIYTYPKKSISVNQYPFYQIIFLVNSTIETTI